MLGDMQEESLVPLASNLRSRKPNREPSNQMQRKDPRASSFANGHCFFATNVVVAFQPRDHEVAENLVVFGNFSLDYGRPRQRGCGDEWTHPGARV